MLEKDYYELEGYKVPLKRAKLSVENMELDEEDNVVMECYSVPFEWVQVMKPDSREFNTWNFIVKVVDDFVDMVKVEFPVFDAMDFSNEAPQIPLVKLYRGKLKS